MRYINSRLTYLLASVSATFRPRKGYRYGAEFLEVRVGFVGSLKKMNCSETARTRKALKVAQNSGNGGLSSCDRST